jgi:hypothetical protein
MSHEQGNKFMAIAVLAVRNIEDSLVDVVPHSEGYWWDRGIVADAVVVDDVVAAV